MIFSAVAKTNFFVGTVLTIGFCLLTGIYYRSLYKDSMALQEYETSHKAAEIYAEIVPDFLKAIKISNAMSKDGFLVSYLMADDSYDMPSFKATISKYLNGYYKYNDFSGVFLILEKNKAYYTQNGFMSFISQGTDLYKLYRQLMTYDHDYDITIDFDRNSTSNNEISLFVNQKVRDWSQSVLGITGVYIHLDDMMSKIFNFEITTRTSVSFINASGRLQLSSHTTGISEINWLDLSGNEAVADELEKLQADYVNLHKDHIFYINTKTNNFIIIKYIPELSWFLVVESYMGDFLDEFRNTLLVACTLIAAILVILIVFISNIISRADKKTKLALEDRMRYFQDATRNMFGSIYEIDVTKDIFSPESKMRQFDALKNMGELSYSESLRLFAQRFIKKEFQENFLATFSCKNILLEYSRGTEHISMDCQFLVGEAYQWVRFECYIFFIERDKSVYMYLYSKNINTEVTIMAEARTDSLTGCLTRGALEQAIEEALMQGKEKLYAFFIIDIDNFKRANDTFGHGFGDFCIQQFAIGIRNAFRSNDIIGRIGGDEFVVFLHCPSREWVHEKAVQLVRTLDMDCEQGKARLHISSSIGIALYPHDGEDMATLYRNADAALYVVKENGKNNYQFFGDGAVCGIDKKIHVLTYKDGN